MRIKSSDPNNIECRLSVGRLDAQVNAQAMVRAYNQFNTLSAHFAQAFGPGTVHDAANTPTDLALPYAAFWIAGQDTLYATTGTYQSEGGSYVTVEVTGHGSQSARLSLAQKLATATIAVAPRVPSPGAAPS
jgi:hypothetical protein